MNFLTLQRWTAGAAAVSLIALGGGCSRLPEHAVDFASIETQIQGWIDSGYYDGAGFIVADQGGTIYSGCFGNYRSDDPVYIASAGKWLAAATIASVVDRGKLSWDDKASRYVRGLRRTMGDATLRQLLSHTAGYPAYQPEGRTADRFGSLAESVEYLLPLDPACAPGERFEYGGLAMQVAGRMAEMATGKDWETLFQKNIAVPLGMTRSGFTPVDTLPGYSPMLGGGAHTTLDDYARFLDMFFHRGKYGRRQVLSEASVAEMMKDQVGRAEVQQGEFPERMHLIPRNDLYGLGLWRETADADGAPIIVSSPGWAGAYPWIDWEYELYGFFIAHVNSDRAKKGDFSAFYTSPKLSSEVRSIVLPIAR